MKPIELILILLSGVILKPRTLPDVHRYCMLELHVKDLYRYLKIILYCGFLESN